MQAARQQPSCVLLLVVLALAIAAFTQPAAGAGASAQQQQQQLQQQQKQQQQNAAASLQPPTWPEQFKSVMFQNRTNKLALVTLYYDWRAGANLNIISSQLGAAGTVWDLEWNNGTSFIFSRDQPVCKTLHFDVGILTPDWLADAKYLGQTAADNFVTNVWTKADFINYYADKDTTRPVRWTFLWSGAEFHTMEWDEGATLHKDMWQAPDYCFNQPPAPPAPAGGGGGEPSVLDNPIATGRMMRLNSAAPTAAQAKAAQQQSSLQLQGAQHAAAKLPTS